MQGGPLSVVIGYCLAGWLSELFGWRAMFVLLGLPGLVLVALARFTLKEPRSTMPSERAVAATAEDQPTLREVMVTLGSNKSFRHLLFCISIVYFFTQGIGQWQPAFFMRSYGIGAGELGTWFTVIWGLGGLIGTYLGGEWAYRRAAGNEPLQLRVMGIAYGVFGLISVGVYLSPNRYVAFGLLGLASIGVNTTSGPLFATIQSLVPGRMRALSIALIYLCANLIGMGLGPLAAGALSDAFRPWAGDESLRYALLTLCPGYLWATWHLWRGSRTVGRDLSLFKESSHAIETRYPAKPAVSRERGTVHGAQAARYGSDQ
jgi:MFS family permease